MTKSEFIQGIEEKLIANNQTTMLIEINLFVYWYEKGCSRILYENNEYLCLFLAGHMCYGNDLFEDEQEK